MKKAKKPIDLYLITLFLLGGAAVVLRTVACFFEWNGVTMHFDDKVCITLGNVLVILAILLFSSHFILAKKGDNLIASSKSSMTYIPSGMVSVALLFMSIEKLVGMKNPYISENAVLSVLSVIIAILGIASALSFFLTIFIQKNENIYKASFNMAVVAFLAIYAAYLYFNKESHPTNSPAKIVDMMAYLFAAMFFLYEARISLGRALWRPYTVFGLAASLFTAYSAIPALIYYTFSGVCISDSIYESALTLSLFVFITARVLLLRNLSHEGACETAKCIEALAEMRESEIAEKASHAHAGDNDNMEEIPSEDFENYTMDIPMPESDAEITAEKND